MKKFLLFIFLFFLGCQEEYFLVKNIEQLEGVKKIIKDLDWEITDIDTFWSLDGKSAKYRIMYKPNGKKITQDSLTERIRKIFELE